MEFLLKNLLLEVTNEVWVEPTFDEELDQFQHISEELGLPIENLRDAFNEGSLQYLRKPIIEKLNNSDLKKIESYSDVVNLIQKNQKKDPTYEPDWKSLQQAIKSKSKLPAPIIMKYNSEYYLIAGNIRLMLTKILNQPFIGYVFSY